MKNDFPKRKSAPIEFQYMFQIEGCRLQAKLSFSYTAFDPQNMVIFGCIGAHFMIDFRPVLVPRSDFLIKTVFFHAFLDVFRGFEAKIAIHPPGAPARA